MSDDAVRPKHYTDLNPEPIEVIEAWKLGFFLGNAVKYIARHARKGAALEDLKKARWYLDREIQRNEEALRRVLPEQPFNSRRSLWICCRGRTFDGFLELTSPLAVAVVRVLQAVVEDHHLDPSEIRSLDDWVVKNQRGEELPMDKPLDLFAVPGNLVHLELRTRGANEDPVGSETR